MNTPLSQSETQAELEKIYSVRFAGLEAYRDKVWHVLVNEFFSRWIKPEHSVLDLGCGYCEFINNVTSAEKFAMDLNPSARSRVSPETGFIEQDCSAPCPLPEDSLDVVFSVTSLNIFRQRRRCRRPCSRHIVASNRAHISSRWARM